MRVLSIIFGILMVICGICCLFTPLGTALALNIFIVIMAAVYGVVGIIMGISEKHFGVGFVFSIISVLFSIAVLIFPILLVDFKIIVSYMAVCWIIIMGIVSIVSSIQVSKLTDSKMWIFELIIGILSVLLGIYSLFHPIVFSVTIDWLIGLIIGVYFIMTGFSMIFITSEAD